MDYSKSCTFYNNITVIVVPSGVVTSMLSISPVVGTINSVTGTSSRSEMITGTSSVKGVGSSPDSSEAMSSGKLNSSNGTRSSVSINTSHLAESVHITN